MKTGYKAHAVVRLRAAASVEVVEVLPELSAAICLAEQRAEEDRRSQYVVCETTVRYPRSKPLLQKEAKRLILKEWNKRPSDQRTEGHMFGFFSDLRSDMQELTQFKTRGDAWQDIVGWLSVEESKGTPTTPPSLRRVPRRN